VFKGTRVAVTSLFEVLQSGGRIDDFLAWFPGVAREQVVLALAQVERSLIVVCRARRAASGAIS